eukprot:TRINITY_DN9319_c0_g1_i1.p1 TRINITY_DN9319_c0_g1~~TRINITY_DN9319_c0_g1_i1.p1  ORF type:complete len:276 (+),score=52.24 TRINITY_DN9319_c0_g1_i1:109-936(+)
MPSKPLRSRSVLDFENTYQEYKAPRALNGFSGCGKLHSARKWSSRGASLELVLPASLLCPPCGPSLDLRCTAGLGTHRVADACTTSISALPCELLLSIFCYLDSTAVRSVARVCKDWATLADDDVIWRRLCRLDWGLETTSQPTFRAAYFSLARMLSKPVRVHGNSAWLDEQRAGAQPTDMLCQFSPDFRSFTGMGKTVNNLVDWSFVLVGAFGRDRRSFHASKQFNGRHQTNYTGRLECEGETLVLRGHIYFADKTMEWHGKFHYKIEPACLST